MVEYKGELPVRASVALKVDDECSLIFVPTIRVNSFKQVAIDWTSADSVDIDLTIAEVYNLKVSSHLDLAEEIKHDNLKQWVWFLECA